MAPANPFVYGEIVPPDAFLDREPERAQLAQDLLDGQKVFLVAPRRYGKVDAQLYREYVLRETR